MRKFRLAAVVVAVLTTSLIVADDSLDESKQIGQLENLMSLSVYGADVTNVGLSELRALKKLTKLDLSGTRISNEALDEINRFSDLTSLSVSSTKITDAATLGIRKFQETGDARTQFHWDNR